ncbi:hypothetical protein D3C77_607460 [compost metagenome]
MRHAHAQAIANCSQRQRRRTTEQLEHSEDNAQFGRLQRQTMPQALKKRPKADLPGTKQEEKRQRRIGRRRKLKT